MADAPQAQPTQDAPKTKRGMGMLGYLGVLMGGGCLLFAGVGLVNTALNLKLVLKVSGARTPLPDNYEVCAALALLGGLFIGLAFFGSFVTAKFRAAKGRPLVRIGILLGALVFLAVVGRGLQVMALTSTYGSMLAYYATDGDLEDVKAELAKGPSPEALDAAVSRAAQYDNVGALKLLLAAGADFEEKSEPEDRRRCYLGSTPAFVQAAVEHGVAPATCPDSEFLIHNMVRDGEDDQATAEIVGLLVKAGWSTAGHPKHSKLDALGQAKRRKLVATQAALGAK